MPQVAISFTLIMRIEMPNENGAFGIPGQRHRRCRRANCGSRHALGFSNVRVVRDVTINVSSDVIGNEVRDAVEALDGVRIISACRIRRFSRTSAARFTSSRRLPVKTRKDLSTVYTPGVARVSMAIAADPSKAFQLSIKRNTVAVVSDGTAVLGLGDIGPLGALPVMEGKAMLFKQFAGIDAFPICLDTKDVDEIVETVVRIAPVFGGINLEDISAPRCFEVEQRLIELLDIPVMHDDQHGTAVVILAALINAAKVVGKELDDLQIVVSGSGAAGTATIKMLLEAGVRDVIPVDRNGALNRDGPLRKFALALACRAHEPGEPARHARGGASGADVFIGVSAPGILQPEHIASMARDPIVFAMANPTPEIMPDVAAPVRRR